MVSNRKRKQEAASRDLSLRELELAELLEDVLQAMRWQQILSYTNQFLLDRFVKVDPAERDKVLEAAVRAVDKDAKLHEWSERLARLKAERVGVTRAMRRAQRDIDQGRTASEVDRPAERRSVPEAHRSGDGQEA